MSLGPARFLALGDSYTIGEGVARADGWPAQLAGLLRHSFLLDDPTIIARTGWTTDELGTAIDVEVPKPWWALVSLLIGVNNHYRGRSVEEYGKEFAVLLTRAVALAGAPTRVVVLSIPDWGVTPFAEGRDRAAIAGEIDAFNAVNRGAALAADARYVDITPISRAARLDWIAADGLHPSAVQYGAWAQAALGAAAAALGGAA